MTKGKPWTVQEERELKRLREESKTVAEIAMRLRKSEDAIKQKLRRMGFKQFVVTLQNSGGTTTSELVLPEELPSGEESLKLLAGAMDALSKPGIPKSEIARLRSLVSACKVYQALLAQLINYGLIERRLSEMSEKYDRWIEREREKSKADSDSGSEEEESKKEVKT